MMHESGPDKLLAILMRSDDKGHNALKCFAALNVLNHCAFIRCGSLCVTREAPKDVRVSGVCLIDGHLFYLFSQHVCR